MLKNIGYLALVSAIIALVFTSGWVVRDRFGPITLDDKIEIAGDFNFVTREKASPADRISEEQIYVYEDHVMLDVENVKWAKFADTNSMDPLFDTGHNSLQLIPKTPEDIQIGDIVSYKSEFADGIVAHRVVEIGNDGEWYAIVKGDNNTSVDPGKIRFSQIERVLIAIIY